MQQKQDPANNSKKASYQKRKQRQRYRLLHIQYNFLLFLNVYIITCNNRMQIFLKQEIQKKMKTLCIFKNAIFQSVKFFYILAHCSASHPFASSCINSFKDLFFNYSIIDFIHSSIIQVKQLNTFYNNSLRKFTCTVITSGKNSFANKLINYNNKMQSLVLKDLH